MFHTYPEAEQFIPQPLAQHGERAWHWVELGLNLPYYLMELLVDADGVPMVKHITTASLEVVTEASKHMTGHTRLRSVSLLSPGYVNGSDGYQLDRIAEIWSPNPTDRSRLLFVLADSRSLRFRLDEEGGTEEDFHLLLDFTQLAD